METRKKAMAELNEKASLLTNLLNFFKDQFKKWSRNDITNPPIRGLVDVDEISPIARERRLIKETTETAEVDYLIHKVNKWIIACENCEAEVEKKNLESVVKYLEMAKYMILREDDLK